MARALFQLLLGVVLLATGFGVGVVFAANGVDSTAITPTSTQLPAKATPTLADTETSTTLPTATPVPTSTHSPTATASPAGSPTPSLTPSRTPSITPTPTYDPPDARVLVQSNCRYGPGAAYLYEWGLFPGDRVEIHGRDNLGEWVYVDPWTYVDRCWVRAELLDVFRGDVFEAPPYYGRLPLSDLYLPPTNPRATRRDNEVEITWNTVWMTEDDNRGYLVEAWLCRDGQVMFTPIQTWSPPIFVIDEPGCLTESSARLYTAEKHGYTRWIRVPWPGHPTPTPGPGGVK